MIKVQVVHAIIKRDEKFLLGKRSVSKKNAAGFWATVGGRVEAGETVEDGLIRECFEEIGVNVKLGKKILDLFEPEADHFWFEVEIIAGEPKVCNDEHSSIGWFLKSDVESLSPITEEDLKIIRVF
jgi:8-oxo-dGTP diphosphatase